MRSVVLGLACLLAAPPEVARELVRAQHDQDHDHAGTYEEAVAHKSGDDLRAWWNRHPWSLGDRMGASLAELLAARRAGERTEIERHELVVAFLAEMIARDPFSAWAIDVFMWETEECAHQETAAQAMASLPSLVAEGESDSAWKQIEELKTAVVPQGGWPLLAPELARCAAAFLHAGDAKRAQSLATDLATSAESLRQGTVFAACERILGEVARLEGRFTDAAERTAHAFEIAAALDTGPAISLVESIESFGTCGIDTLVQLSPSATETLLVVVGEKARALRKLPSGREALLERIRELGAETQLLGPKLGIVADGALAELPFEQLLPDRVIVRLARPPLGAVEEAKAPAAKRTWLAVLDPGAAAPALGSDDVRTVRAGSQDEFRKAAAGRTHLYVDADAFSAEGLRGWKLDAEVAVLARVAKPGLVEALHAAGVRDVLVSNRDPAADDRKFLADVCARVAGGMPLPDAMRAMRAARDASSRAWTAWIVRRRS